MLPMQARGTCKKTVIQTSETVHFVSWYKSALFTFCNRLYVSNDPVWLTQGTPYHLLYVLARILEAFADAPNSVSYGER